MKRTAREIKSISRGHKMNKKRRAAQWAALLFFNVVFNTVWYLYPTLFTLKITSEL